ncbi:MAG: Omp28-related outer membrane protein [Bacteroidaceae bacterium]|nr:Omp28-related outer membrane protein [Bacteroidaceae bacterium]
MIRRIFTAALLFATVCLSSQAVVRYGYAPEEIADINRIFQGQGGNGYLGGMICLDPAADPVVARLEGHQVKGVRCYLNHDYMQARQKRSMIMHTSSLEAEPTTKVCDFVAGWNEIYFDEPITIGAEPIYLGLQVYESGSASHPLVSYGSASVPGACLINLNKQGWTNYDKRGTLLIQAILDDEAAPVVDNMVYAQVATTPQAVAPAAPFESEIFFNNYTDQAVNSVELHMQGQGDEAPRVMEILFDTPLAAREGRNLPMDVYTGSEVGVSQWIKLEVTKINGVEAQEARPGITHHYVTKDAFNRMSVVEEFTSQNCVNCPFMIYYLDKAMHQYDKEVVYITHHVGFVADLFTKPGETDLLYIFGEEGTFNPAVMYDRRIMPGKVTPINGASVAETTPYTQALDVVTNMLAMAEVNIEVAHDKEAGKVGCTVSGRVNSEMVAAGIDTYITVCFVEDGIPVSDKYFQKGLEETEGAPEDLIESFRHNGIKRHVFTAQTGDLLTFDGSNEYSITYDAVELSADWNIDNCRIAAFVHKVDKVDMSQNEILNASQEWLTALGAIEGVESDSEAVRFYVDNNRTIAVQGDVASYQIYNVHGQYMPTGAHLLQGVYVVSYKTRSGECGTAKLLVR